MAPTPRPYANRRQTSRNRYQINVSVEAERMMDALLQKVRNYSPQSDATISEIFQALVVLLYDASEHLDLSRVPRRGRWGDPTARAFPIALARAFEQAVVARFNEGYSRRR